MAYWSVFRSVDYMDEHCDYPLPQQREAALAAATQALAEDGRVVVEPNEEGLSVTTVLHTPAWAWVGLVWLVFVRRERHAVITAAESPQGSTLHVRGKLDTRAASRLRALRAS
jgi:hypothetical protein